MNHLWWHRLTSCWSCIASFVLSKQFLQKNSLCAAFFVQKCMTIHGIDFKQTSKQTNVWNLWSRVHLFHILLECLFCSQPDIHCSSRTCLHAVLVSFPPRRLESKSSVKLKQLMDIFVSICTCYMPVWAWVYEQQEQKESKFTSEHISLQVTNSFVCKSLVLCSPVRKKSETKKEKYLF